MKIKTIKFKVIDDYTPNGIADLKPYFEINTGALAS